jgi:2-polyprenyl-3-methyl-5-hydroxy-6-metoxy-1,4-benzoquinol methylase
VYEAFQRLVGNQQLYEFLVSEHIRPTEGLRILDIGCGTAEIARWFEGVEYSGFDPNPRYVERAQRMLRPGFRVWQGSIAEPFSGDDLYDLVLGLGVLHHVDDDSAGQFFALASQHLGRSGRVVTIDPCRHPAQRMAARLLVSADRGRWVRTPSHYERLARKEFDEVEVNVHDGLLNIPFSHVIMSIR